MRTWRAALLRIGGLFGARRHDRDLNDELDAHLQFHIDDNIRAGMTPDDARRDALLKLGGASLALEQSRDRRGVPFLETFVRDLQYASRLLRKHPTFAVAAILTLALGIGANTAMFSFADASAFRPPDVPRPGELVRIFSSSKDVEYDRVSYADYLDFKAHATTLSSIVAYDTALVAMSQSHDEVPQLFGAWVVTANFFSALEVPIALGRGFRDGEDRVAGASPVVIISHGLWQRRFRSDAAVVGKRAILGTREFTIVGVTPEGFAGTELYFHPDLYIPLTMSRDVLSTIPPNFLDDRSDRWLTVLGRLGPGTSVRQASAELSTLARSLEHTYPGTNKNRTALALPEVTARGRLDAGGYQGAALMLILVGLVLVIACANVANLLLSRAAGRTKEIAMRLALGASRGRLIQQLLTESLLLSMVGGALGLLVAHWSLSAVSSVVHTMLTATDMPLALNVGLDRRALIFTAAISIATGLLFGLAPALLSTRVDLIPALKAPTTTAGGRRRWLNFRNALVASQVALAVVVLTVAGLAIRGVIDKQHIDPGFRVDRVLVMSFNPGLVRYDQLQTRAFYQQIVERTRALPGVAAAGLAQFVPLGINSGSVSVVVDGYDMPPGQDRLTIRSNVVDDGYWGAMRTPIVRGRAFEPRDSASSVQAAIINETMARRYWPDQDAIGKTLRLRDRSGPMLQVVGVARDGKYGEIAEAPQPYLFLPFSQRFRAMMTLVVLAKRDAAALAAPIRAEVAAVGGGVPTFDVRTLDDIYESRAMAPARLTSLVMIALGLLGLVLAVIGLYGVIAYLTALRTREIGIRMAVGADSWSVVRLVLGQGVGVMGAGLAAGVGLALGATPALAIPFDFRPRDATVTIVVSLVLVAFMLAAALVPALRAATLDPVTALRDE